MAVRTILIGVGFVDLPPGLPVGSVRARADFYPKTDACTLTGPRIRQRLTAGMQRRLLLW